jgi:hypothetical protein
LRAQKVAKESFGTHVDLFVQWSQRCCFMRSSRVYLPLCVLLFTAALSSAKDKSTVCVSADSEQKSLTSAMPGFEKAAIKQVSSRKQFAGATKAAEHCDYRLSLTIDEQRPLEAGVVGRTADDPLLREQAERPYIKFLVSYRIESAASDRVVAEGSAFRREDSYPDPSARMSAIEAAVDEGLKKLPATP